MPRKSKKTADYPCGKCKSECACNSILCGECGLWYHTKCEMLSSDQTKLLGANPFDYICLSCCMNDNGDYDTPAALNRMYKSMQGNEKNFRSAAIREQIQSRSLPNISNQKFEACGLVTDSVSMELLQRIDGKNYRRPVYVSGDGNCLYSATSIAISGSPKHSAQLKLQTAIELCLNGVHYKNKQKVKGFGNISSTYAEACLEAAKDGAYSGTWQMQALASVIGRPIISVYPPFNGLLDLPARALNTTIEPKNTVNQEPIYIMWTSTTASPSRDSKWHPNHFVPLIDESQDIVTLDPSISPVEWPELSRGKGRKLRGPHCSTPLKSQAKIAVQVEDCANDSLPLQDVDLNLNDSQELPR